MTEQFNGNVEKFPTQKFYTSLHLKSKFRGIVLTAKFRVILTAKFCGIQNLSLKNLAFHEIRKTDFATTLT
jgi:hypothetical protein